TTTSTANVYGPVPPGWDPNRHPGPTTWGPSSPWARAGGRYDYVPTTAGNGYTVYAFQAVPPQTAANADPGSAAGWYKLDGSGPFATDPRPVIGTTTTTTTTTPILGYNPPGQSGYVGLYKTENRSVVIPVLLCPSDPSPKKPGLVYTDWSATNYLANWN